MDAKVEFVWKIHSYINEYIRLADAKALGLLAVFVALDTLLLENRDPKLSDFQTFLVAASVLVSIFGFLLGVWVVFPRVRGTGPGIIYWKHISDVARADFERRFIGMTPEDLLQELISHTHQLSGIATDKYRHLQSAFAVAVVLIPLAIVTIALT